LRTPSPQRSFVDSSALYAILDDRDVAHEAAVSTYEELVPSSELVTHAYVVIESAALVQRRLGQRPAKSLFLEILAPVRVCPVPADIHEAAAAMMLASDSSSISFVDWTSFEFMRREALHTAFAFDDHFRREGFVTVP
jgi:predicted nucleic acid-binding protein